MKTAQAKRRKRSQLKRGAARVNDAGREAAQIYDNQRNLMASTASPRVVKTRVQPHRSPMKAFVDNEANSNHQF